MRLDHTRFAPGEAPPFSARSSETDAGVTVVDLSFGAGEVSTDAYLVLPDAAAPGPGMVFFHWLEYGSPTSNRTEFLDEARDLASRGVVSLLVDGRFPWKERPTSIEHDLTAVEAEARMLRGAVDLLRVRPEVDSPHIALVGHDFGAMYAAIVFAADPTLDGLVMMAPTARWADWFLRYWQIPDAEPDYLAAMAPLDPVIQLPRTEGRPVLLQFGSDDEYVPQAIAEEITAAAGSSVQSLTYRTSHHLDHQARADRAAWLMGLTGATVRPVAPRAGAPPPPG